jgi:hypothetical protein
MELVCARFQYRHVSRNVLLVACLIRQMKTNEVVPAKVVGDSCWNRIWPVFSSHLLISGRGHQEQGDVPAASHRRSRQSQPCLVDDGEKFMGHCCHNDTWTQEKDLGRVGGEREEIWGKSKGGGVGLSPAGSEEKGDVGGETVSGRSVTWRSRSVLPQNKNNRCQY